MKNTIATLIGLTLTLTASSGLAQIQKEDAGVYICALSPNNMIGLAPQYTVFLNEDATMITQSVISDYTYQIEEARTHKDDPAQIKAVASGYEITARMYSSETAALVGEKVFSLDPEALAFTLPSVHGKILLPCQKVYPRN